MSGGSCAGLDGLTPLPKIYVCVKLELTENDTVGIVLRDVPDRHSYNFD